MTRDNKEKLINAILTGDKKEAHRLKRLYDKWMVDNSIDLNSLSDSEAMPIVKEMIRANGQYLSKGKRICYSDISKISSPILHALNYKMEALNGTLEGYEQMHGKNPFNF